MSTTIWQCVKRTNDHQSWTGFGMNVEIHRGTDDRWTAVLSRLDGPPVTGRGAKASSAFKAARQALARVKGEIRLGRPSRLATSGATGGSGASVGLPCSPGEKAFWLLQAAEQGLSLSAYIRSFLPTPPAELAELDGFKWGNDWGESEGP